MLLVSGGLFGGEASGPPSGYSVDNFDAANLESSLPPGPITLELERATFPPDALLPGPPPGALWVAMAEPEGGFLAEQRDGSFRNLDAEQVVAYVLTLRPAGAEEAGTLEATPTA